MYCHNHFFLRWCVAILTLTYFEYRSQWISYLAASFFCVLLIGRCAVVRLLFDARYRIAHWECSMFNVPLNKIYVPLRFSDARLLIPKNVYSFVVFFPPSSIKEFCREKCASLKLKHATNTITTAAAAELCFWIEKNRSHHFLCSIQTLYENKWRDEERKKTATDIIQYVSNRLKWQANQIKIEHGKNR